jgi:hypothetical protein
MRARQRRHDHWTSTKAPCDPRGCSTTKTKDRPRPTARVSGGTVRRQVVLKLADVTILFSCLAHVPTLILIRMDVRST